MDILGSVYFFDCIFLNQKIEKILENFGSSINMTNFAKYFGKRKIGGKKTHTQTP
jgi:hypothetical protein